MVSVMALIACGCVLILMVLLKVTCFPDHAPNTDILIDLLNRLGAAASNSQPGNRRSNREVTDGGATTPAGSVRSQQRPQPDGGGVSESSGC